MLALHNLPQPLFDQREVGRRDRQTSDHVGRAVQDFVTLPGNHAFDQRGAIPYTTVGYRRREDRHLERCCQIKSLPNGHGQGFPRLPGNAEAPFLPVRRRHQPFAFMVEFDAGLGP